MKRGEIWWATLESPVGRRPVLVVQSDSFNDSRIRTVVVALITSNLGLEGGPGNVRLPRGEGGVLKPSVVNVSQLYTIDRASLAGRLGMLTAPTQQRVDAGLRLVLALPGGAAPGVMEPSAEYLVRQPRRKRRQTLSKLLARLPSATFPDDIPDPPPGPVEWPG